MVAFGLDGLDRISVFGVCVWDCGFEHHVVSKQSQRGMS